MFCKKIDKKLQTQKHYEQVNFHKVAVKAFYLQGRPLR